MAEVDDDFFDDFIGDDETEESLDLKLASSKRPRVGKGSLNPRQPLAERSANTPAPKAGKKSQGSLAGWLVPNQGPAQPPVQKKQESTKLFGSTPNVAASTTKTGPPRGYKARTSSAAKDPNRTVESLPPREVLDHMLKGAAAHVSKDGTKPFESFVAHHGLDKIFGYLKSTFKPWVWDNLIEGDKATDIAYLKAIPVEKRLPDKPGFYIGIIEDDNDPDFVALYGGQGGSIVVRIFSAKGHRWSVLNADKGSLLYFFWRGDTRVVPPKGTQIEDLPRKCKFVCAGVDESGLLGQDQKNFWDIGEMFLTLMLRSLQEQDLKKWLPADCSIDTPARRANIQLPLFQNHKSQHFDLGASIHSTDPAVAAYAQQTLNPKMSAEQQAKRDHRMMEKTTTGSRKKGKNQEHFRDPDASLGDPDKVKVKCVTCGTVKFDTQVQFLKSTRQYCARSTACPKCPPTEYQKKKGLKQGIKMFHPVGMPKEKWVEKDRLRF